MENKYLSKVNDIATTLAKHANNIKIKLGDTFAWDEKSKGVQQSLIDEWTPAAKSIVADMATYYRFAYMSNCPGEEGDKEWELWWNNCTNEMIECELIPE